MRRIGQWPQRIALGVATVWGLAAGMMFAFARTEQAWMVFIGGYQTSLLLTAIATVLGGTALRRGEWGRALVLGVGTTLAVTTLYLVGATMGSAGAPSGLVHLSNGVALQRKPDLLTMAPGFYLAGLGLGTVLGPGFLLFSPGRTPGRRRAPILRMPAQFPPPAVYRAKGDPYRPGPLPVRAVRLAPGHCAAPAPLTIHAPTAPGQYPVVLFQHGFLLHPGCFSSVLTHLASHGFVVVAPQMYAPRGLPLDKPSSVAEAELAEEIVDWMSQHLNQVAGVTARPDCLGVAGHSRGAKVAWWLLKSGHSPIRAVAGVDPVDGAIKLAADPRVLDGSFAATVPALVIGTELGPVLPGPFTSPSAPTGRNHVQFFAACAGPAWHVLLRDHGHLDMLDDLSGTYVRRGMCVGGADREGARRTTAGLLAVFFRGTLQEDAAALRVLSDADAAPLPVEVSAKVPEVRDALRAA